MKSSNRSNKRLRRFCNVLVLLAGFSLWQYLTTGTVHWPAALYQQVSASLADSPASADVGSPQSSGAAKADGTAGGFNLTGRVVRIADGDTVTILDHNNTQHKVRLFGIDTPERNQPYGKAAKNALVQLIDKKPVGVIIVARDKYGREVGTLYRDGINVNAALVAGGYAWWYQYYAPHDQALQLAEQKAREHRLGLWADPHPVAPWDWRRKQR